MVLRIESRIGIETHPLTENKIVVVKLLADDFSTNSETVLEIASLG